MDSIYNGINKLFYGPPSSTKSSLYRHRHPHKAHPRVTGKSYGYKRPTAPKRPKGTPGFHLYSIERMPELRDQYPEFGRRFRALTEGWRGLSADEKTSFADKAEQYNLSQL